MSAAVIIDSRVKSVLRAAGWVFVGRRRTDKVEALPSQAEILQHLLDTIYVDNRRKVQVEALEEARRIAKNLW